MLKKLYNFSGKNQRRALFLLGFEAYNFYGQKGVNSYGIR